jgi:GT2 family glycosyltransferase
MLDVSVIIVSWNAKEHLYNCLRSLNVLRDGYKKEVVVVDNASTDGTVELVEEKFPEVKLIRNKENLGFARANNIGIRESSGRYICLINSDVILLDDCIGKLMTFMDDHPSVGMVGPKILNPDGSLQPQCQHFPSIWNHLCQTLGFNKLFPKSGFFSEPFMRYWAHNEIRKVDVISGCFWIVRREAVDQVGLLDESFFFYGEDIDWCRRFHAARWDVIFYPDACAIHFGSGSSNNAPIRFYLELQKADLQYWKKHHGSTGRTIYSMIILLRHLLRLISTAVKYLIFPSGRKTASFKLRRNLACIRWIIHI